MIRIGENDFLRAFDAMSEMARKEPVAITKQGRDRLVVMSAEEYMRLKHGEHPGLRRGQPRRTWRIGRCRREPCGALRARRFSHLDRLPETGRERGRVLLKKQCF